MSALLDRIEFILLTMLSFCRVHLTSAIAYECGTRTRQRDALPAPRPQLAVVRGGGSIVARAADPSEFAGEPGSCCVTGSPRATPLLDGGMTVAGQALAQFGAHVPRQQSIRSWPLDIFEE